MLGSVLSEKTSLKWLTVVMPLLETSKRQERVTRKMPLSKACFYLEILQFEVAPNFGTFAQLFRHPLVTYLYTPHMHIFWSHFF